MKDTRKFSSAFATALAWRHLGAHLQRQTPTAEGFIIFMSELTNALVGSVQPSIPTGATLG